MRDSDRTRLRATRVQPDIAARHIARRVARPHLPERRPGADIVPPHLGRHHRRLAGMFHDGIIDRVGRARGKIGLAEAAEIQVPPARV